MRQDNDFEQAVEEAWSQPVFGWDFTYIAGRMVSGKPSWDYRQLVLPHVRQAHSLLDMDTGDGEFLADLQPLPPDTWATEGYPPNIPVAKACLEPLGVRICDTRDEAQPLPFSANTFDLIINRHGSFRGDELYNILKPGGWFITQQVGGRNCIGLNELLQDDVEFPYADWTLAVALTQLKDAGLKIVTQREEFPLAEFRDIGALVFYLKIVSWQVSDFSPEKYARKLRKIYETIQETGHLTVTEHRFLIEATKE